MTTHIDERRLVPTTNDPRARYGAAGWVEHRLCRAPREGKIALLTGMLRRSEMRSLLVFANDQADAGQIARAVTRSGVQAAHLDADHSQEQRTAAIEAFRSGDVPVLIATDAAGQMLVVPRLSHVVNFDVPPCPADYLNRAARLARVAGSGAVLTFVAPDEESALQRILSEIGLAASCAETSADAYAHARGRRRNRSRRRARHRARCATTPRPRFGDPGGADLRV
ncbi:MAG: C-terminal helicase domain-containing protein [bacterium]